MSKTHENLREIHNIGVRTREMILTPQNCPPLPRLGIPLAGISEAGPGFHFVRREPSIAQVLVTLSGEGEVWVDGAWQRCQAGQAYLTPVGVFHAYRAIHSHTAWTVGWVTYQRPSDVVPGNIPLLRDVEPELLATTLRGLYHEATQEGDLALLDEWSNLVHAYARRLARPSVIDRRLDTLFSLVSADLSHPWTLTELADRACLSGESLRRLAHERYGISPMAQLTNLRLRHAATLLSTGHYNVEQVAFRVGYANPYAFSAAFKRHYGKTPSQMRPTR